MRQRWSKGKTEDEIRVALEDAKVRLVNLLAPFAGKEVEYRMIKTYPRDGTLKEWTHGTLAVAPEQFAPRALYNRPPWGYRVRLPGVIYGGCSIVAEDLLFWPDFEIRIFNARIASAAEGMK